MITILVDSNRSFMWAFGKRIKCSCIILPRINMPPAYPEHQDGSPGSVAYQPVKFPTGDWIVGMPVSTTNPEMAPYFIPTNAHQNVLCIDGSTFDDYGYGIHFDSLYESTWGCLHLYSAADARWLAEQIVEAKAANEAVGLSVA
jgi:hypothetical protein